MAVVVLDPAHFLVPFGEELVVVEVAGIAGDSVVVTHVDGLGHLLAGHKCLVELLAVTCADDLHLGFAVFRIDLCVDLFQGLGESVECCGGSLLDEEVAVVAVGEGVDHEIDGVVERHHEARHLRIGDGDRLTLHHLLDPERDDRTTARHYVAVAGATDGGLRSLA